MERVLVNIGCGSNWHPAWTNLDIRPASREVRQWDVGNGLPFKKAEVDACYASHVLEHFTRNQARALLRECLRVLRPGGILRLAVPDLEGIVREYLKVLAQAEQGDPTAAQRYEWISLELLDQLVRTESGGDMARYLKTEARRNGEYVLSRVGLEAEGLMAQGGDGCWIGTDRAANVFKQRVKRIVSSLVGPFVRAVRVKAWTSGQAEIGLRGLLLSGRSKEAFREGLFRLSGECHRWMYDRYSLRQLLEQSGFAKIHVCTAYESQIEGFASFNLDVVSGKVRKPDSLFMEALKPS